MSIFKSPSIPPPPPLPKPQPPPGPPSLTGAGSSAAIQRQILSAASAPGAGTILGGSYGGTVAKKTLLGQ